MNKLILEKLREATMLVTEVRTLLDRDSKATESLAMVLWGLMDAKVDIEFNRKKELDHSPAHL